MTKLKIQDNGHWRFQTINTIANELIKADNKIINDKINNIVNKHKIKINNTAGVKYKGILYQAEYMMGYTLLDSEFHPAMDKILQEQEELKEIIHSIKLILSRTVALCMGWQDLRNALPDFLVDTIKGLSDYQRTDIEAFTIKHDPKLMEEYYRLRPKLEYYSAMRLLA